MRGLTAYTTSTDGLIWEEGLQIIALNKTECEGVELQKFADDLVPLSGQEIKNIYDMEEARAEFGAARLHKVPEPFYFRSLEFIPAEGKNMATYTTAYLCGDVNLSLTQLAPNERTMPLAQAYADYETVTVRGIQQGYLLEESFRGGYGYHLAWDEDGYRFEIVVELNKPLTTPRAEVCALTREDMLSMTEYMTLNPDAHISTYVSAGGPIEDWAESFSAFLSPSFSRFGQIYRGSRNHNRASICATS